jgi:hypothetical protein
MREKIAFLILAHTDLDHLVRLCRAIGPEDDILVHLDLKSPDSISIGAFPSNVEFTSRRVEVYWSDISVVEATLILLEEILRCERDYLRIVLLSGSCYPIKSIEELRRFFSKRLDYNEIKYASLFKEDVSKEHIGPKMLHRLSRWHFRKPLFSTIGNGKVSDPVVFCADKFIRKMASSFLPRNFSKAFPAIAPYFGSQWWALTPECATMVVEYAKMVPELFEFLRYSWSPDEIFFHTIIGNSNLATKTLGLKPYTKDVTRLSNIHLVRNPLNKIFNEHELADILRSDKFFVRKVATGASDELLNALDVFLQRDLGIRPDRDLKTLPHGC